MLIGAAVTQHRRSVIFRRMYPDLSALIERSQEIIGNAGSYNANTRKWNLPQYRRRLDFGAMQYEQNKVRWRGKPHDLKAFDEAPQFTRSQVEFVCGWNRTEYLGQRCRKILTGNPPNEQEGFWLIEMFEPWLDPQASYPAAPGELRWYAVIEGKDEPVSGPEPFMFKGELIEPASRTFIPALVKDNPAMMATGYEKTLKNLPEPLRTQMLYGDFSIGLLSDPWQVIPTAWVKLAQERWKATARPDVPLSCLGTDVARGGTDRTVLAPRYANYVDILQVIPGTETQDGEIAAGYIYRAWEPGGVVHVDVIGIGSSAYDFAKKLCYCVPINFSNASKRKDRSGKFKLRNLRAEAYWYLREALDPQSGEDLALPPDPELLAELCAARWKLGLAGIQIEEKDDIKARLGRSPDKADAVALACMITPSPDTPIYEEFSGRKARRR